MATEGHKVTQTLVAAADYSAAGTDGKLVKIDTAANDQAVLISSANVRADGILMNLPKAGQPAEVVTSGYGKARCGAAIASGGLELTVDATGRVVAASSTNFVFAISRNSTAAAGEWVGVSICGPYAKP